MHRTALITGSASGLGVAFARRLAARGIQVALNYRHSRERCERLADDLARAHGVRVEAFQADATQPGDLEAMVDRIESRLGGVDILIHGAGPFVFERKRLPDYTDLEWNEMVLGNLTSAFHLFRRLIPGMRARAFGRIVTVGFDRIETAPGWMYRSAYAAAKTGLVSLTRTVALEERENGITANMICPGDIRGARKEAAKPAPDQEGSWRKPVGEDLADAIEFLVRPEARFVTGNVLSMTAGVDVLGRYDSGRPQVRDSRSFSIGQTVAVLPWNTHATVLEREERVNQRTLYTVGEGERRAVFTADQLNEVNDLGV